MVTYSKPTTIPRWADTGTIVEPSSAKKDSGWVAPELPPDTYFNWYQNLVGDWVKWLDERIFDSTNPENVRITSPSGAVNGGSLELQSGVAATASGDGGAVSIVSGAGGSTSGLGGDIAITGGDGGSTGGGGSIEITGGSGLYPGGYVFLSGGVGGTGGGSFEAVAGNTTTDGPGAYCKLSGGNAAGTDRDGGDVTVNGGKSTGSGSSQVVLQAAVAGATGTTARNAENFFICDGATDENRSVKLLTSDVLTAGTSAAISVMKAKATSSGNMTDGFGPSLDFAIEDNASGDNGIASIKGVRANSLDDTGQIDVYTTEAGTPIRRFSVYHDGHISSVFGLQAYGELNTILAGAGVVGRGQVSGGAYGSLNDHAGCGVYGAGSEGGAGGYGVIAQADETSPAKSALRVVPQNANPTTPLKGDVHIDSTDGGLRCYNGRQHARLCGNVYALTSQEDMVPASTGVAEAYAASYQFPANSLTAGNVIRIRASISTTNEAASRTFQIRIGGSTVASYTGTLSNNPSYIVLDAFVTVRNVGASAVLGYASVGTYIADTDPTAGVQTIDSTAANSVEVYVTGNSANTYSLRAFTVDVS